MRPEILIQAGDLMELAASHLSEAITLPDGTGGATVQSSGITVADAASGVAEMTSARLVRGQRVISSSPDTQLASDDTLYFSAALTVDLLTSVTTGREFLYVCTSASTLTLDPGGTDTIDGGGAGIALAIPCAAGQAVRLIRSGSGAWRSVQSRLTVGRIVVDVADGALRHYGQTYIGGAWVTVTAVSTTFSAGDPESVGATFSGTTLSWSAGTAVIAASFATEAQYWAVDLSTYSFDGTTPRAISWVLATDGITVTSGGINDYAYIQAALTDGAAPGTWARAIGVRNRTGGNPIALIWNSGNLVSSASTSASGASIVGATSTLWVPLTTIVNGNLMSLDTNEAPVNAASVASAPGVTSGAPDWLVLAVGNETTSRATSIANPRIYLYV